MPRFALLGISAALALLAARPAPAAEPPRYWAMLRDGAVTSGPRIEGGGWSADGASLGGRALWGRDNPVRVLRDTALDLSPPEACVLLADGDVLPGRVERFLPADPEQNLPDRLLVALDAPLQTPDFGPLPVWADRVTRVTATAPKPVASPPGTLEFADGRTVVATAVRFEEGGIKALGPAGVVSAAFGELAELHLPRADAVAAVLDDQTYPPLGEDALIGRLETADGGVLTWCRRQQRVGLRDGWKRRQGPRKDAAGPVEFLYVQPSWALGPILVPVESICCQSYRRRDEVPLGLLPATVLKQQSGVQSWPWRRGRNVLGGVLASGELVCDLGVGTHSHTELAFDLPPGAEQLAGWVGLDRSVGPGACAEGRIYADRVAGEPLFASGLLRGGPPPVRIGPLDLGGARRLVLVSGFGDQGRPPDAYPLDIGDHVDWLMPLVKARPAADRAALLRRLVPGWQAWQLQPADAERTAVEPFWDEFHQRWAPELRLAGTEPVRLVRSIGSVTYANGLVEVVLSPRGSATPARVRLSAGGTPLEPASIRLHPEHVLRVPPGREERFMHKPPVFSGVTLRWDLQAWLGKAVDLELCIEPAAGEPLVWHACRLGSSIAGLPSDGWPLRPDVPLGELRPIESDSPRPGFVPTADALPKPGRDSRVITFLGQQFDRGYGMVADSRVTFAVGPNYRRFVAVVGCSMKAAGPVEVLLDGKPAWSIDELNEDEPAVQIAVDIPPGTKKLTLRVGRSSGGPAPVGWAESGFVTADGTPPAAP